MSARFKFTTGGSSISRSDTKCFGKILLRRSKFSDTNDLNKIDHLKTYIDSHWFNQTINIIVAFKNNNTSTTNNSNTKTKATLASQSSIQLQIESELSYLFGERIASSTPFNSFYCIDITLDLLISQNFLNTYIKPGGFFALSQLNRLDDGNVVAFLPNAKIILNIDKETYQELGLVGKHSKFSDTRYIIELDCRSKDFLPDSAIYRRILWCFKDRLSTVRLITFSLDTNGKLREIKFPEPGTSNIKIIENQKNHATDKYKIPIFNSLQTTTTATTPISHSFETMQKAEQMEFINGWTESIGMILCGIKADQESLIENAIVEPDFSRIGECFVGKVSGFIDSTTINKVIVSSRKLLKLNDQIEWINVHVHGFQDSPVSWNLNEHYYEINGDNDYSVILKPDNEYWTLSTINSTDSYS